MNAFFHNVIINLLINSFTIGEFINSINNLRSYVIIMFNILG